MLTDHDWNRLQQITQAEQLREASELGLLNRAAIERRMRAGEAKGENPFKPPLPGFRTIDEALAREFGGGA